MAVFGWLPLKAVLQTSGVEAVVNARIVTLRSPIHGPVSAKPPQGSTQLSVVHEGDAILHVVNARGDRVRLDDLRRQMSRAVRRVCAFHAISRTAGDGCSSRYSFVFPIFGGCRYVQALSTNMWRTRPLPALVMPPRLTVRIPMISPGCTDLISPRIPR